MFRITEDPSPGSTVQCLDKNYKNECIASVEMDKVGVTAEYVAITPTTSMSMDDDGSSVIRNMSEHF